MDRERAENAVRELLTAFGEDVQREGLMQEKLANDIAECLMLATESPDVYVNIVADHACVSARGAKSDGITDVTSLHGEFVTNKELRAEIEAKTGRG